MSANMLAQLETDAAQLQAPFFIKLVAEMRRHLQLIDAIRAQVACEVEAKDGRIVELQAIVERKSEALEELQLKLSSRDRSLTNYIRSTVRNALDRDEATGIANLAMTVGLAAVEGETVHYAREALAHRATREQLTAAEERLTRIAGAYPDAESRVEKLEGAIADLRTKLEVVERDLATARATIERGNIERMRVFALVPGRNGTVVGAVDSELRERQRHLEEVIKERDEARAKLAETERLARDWEASSNMRAEMCDEARAELELVKVARDQAAEDLAEEHRHCDGMRDKLRRAEAELDRAWDATGVASTVRGMTSLEDVVRTTRAALTGTRAELAAIKASARRVPSFSYSIQEAQDRAYYVTKANDERFGPLYEDHGCVKSFIEELNEWAAANWPSALPAERATAEDVVDAYVHTNTPKATTKTVLHARVVCSTCHDTHKMPVSGNMCTYCPRPCEICRRGPDGVPGAYCVTTPCPCECHKTTSGGAAQPKEDSHARDNGGGCAGSPLETIAAVDNTRTESVSHGRERGDGNDAAVSSIASPVVTAGETALTSEGARSSDQATSASATAPSRPADVLQEPGTLRGPLSREEAERLVTDWAMTTALSPESLIRSGLADLLLSVAGRGATTCAKHNEPWRRIDSNTLQCDGCGETIAEPEDK